MDLNIILEYWNALPEKIQILIICFLGITSVVWMIRNGFLSDITPKILRKKLIYATALIVGAVGGLLGYLLTNGHPDWFWAFVASTGGGASVAIHHLMIKIVIPKLMARFKHKEKEIFKRSDFAKLEKESPEDETEFISRK